MLTLRNMNAETQKTEQCRVRVETGRSKQGDYNGPYSSQNYEGTKPLNNRESQQRKNGSDTILVMQNDAEMPWKRP